jgi:hypothetical protein
MVAGSGVQELRVRGQRLDFEVKGLRFKVKR